MEWIESNLVGAPTQVSTMAMAMATVMNGMAEWLLLQVGKRRSS